MFVSTKLSIGQKAYFFVGEERVQRGIVTAVRIKGINATAQGVGAEQVIDYTIEIPSGSTFEKAEKHVFTSADSAFWSLEPKPTYVFPEITPLEVTPISAEESSAIKELLNS